MAYEPPLKIAIPTPNEFAKGYGINSTGKRGGNLRIRCTNKEYDAVQKEAKHLGISLATFGRWCAVYVAARLREHREASSTSMSIGDEDERVPRQIQRRSNKSRNPKRKKKVNPRASK